MDVVTTCVDKLIDLCQGIAIAKCSSPENHQHLMEADVLNNIDDAYNELRQSQEYVELERKMKQFIYPKKEKGESVLLYNWRTQLFK